MSCNFDHQMAPLALVANLPTRWCHLHCFQSLLPLPYLNCYITLLALSVSIVLVSSSAKVTSVKSQQRTDGRTSEPNYQTPGLPGSDKNPNTNKLSWVINRPPVPRWYYHLFTLPAPRVAIAFFLIFAGSWSSAFSTPFNPAVFFLSVFSFLDFLFSPSGSLESV